MLISLDVACQMPQPINLFRLSYKRHQKIEKQAPSYDLITEEILRKGPEKELFEKLLHKRQKRDIQIHHLVPDH